MGKYLQWLFILSFPVGGLLCGVFLPTFAVLLLGFAAVLVVARVVSAFSDGGSTVGSFLLMMILAFVFFLGLGWAGAAVARAVIS